MDEPCRGCGAESYDCTYHGCDHCARTAGCSECQSSEDPCRPPPCCTMAAEEQAAADRKLFEDIGYRGGFMSIVADQEVIRAR